MITFLFDRRSLTLWMFALTMAAVFLFLGGLLVGLRLNLPPELVRAGAESRVEELVHLAVEHASGPAEPSKGAPPAAGAETEPAAPQPSMAPTTQAPSDSAARDEKPEVGDPVPFAPPGWEPPREPSERGAGVRKAALGGLPELGDRSEAVARPERSAPPERVERPASEPGPSSVSDARFSVQLGAYREKGNAERLRQALEVEGLETYLVVDRRAGGDVLYMVRLGSYTSRAEAQVAAADLTAQGRDAWVPLPASRR